MEMMAGITLMICSVFVSNPSLITLIFIPVFLLAPGLEWLRQRHTYPRVGYARPAELQPARHARGALIFTLAVFSIYALALMGFGVANDVTYWRRWAPALAAAICCGGFLFVASQSGLARHYAYILASLGGGLIFSLIRFERPYQNVHMFLLSLGILIFVSGALIFLRFLHRHPQHGMEGNEHA